MPADFDLEAALDQTHAALLVGDLARLDALITATERAVALPTDPAAMERIRQKADRNAACLKAAARGVRAALRRIAELRAAADQGLLTYDGKGRRARIQPADGALAQRF